MSDRDHNNQAADHQYRRIPGLDARETDGQVYILDEAREQIFSLNETCSAVWRLTEEPVSESECIEIFATAFPDADQQEVSGMVHEAIIYLFDNGVIY